MADTDDSPNIPANQLDILGASICADAESMIEPSVEQKMHLEKKYDNDNDKDDVKETEEINFEYIAAPKDADTSHFVEIPKILHFVWVGNPIPEKYQKNLRKWRKKNPDYEINLWVDGDLLTKDELEKIKKFCKAIKINVVDVVDKIEDPTNKTWYKRDLGGYYDSVIGENRNWAIASNFLRALILEEAGGIYLDTDVYPQKRLPSVIKVPPHGLLLKVITSPIMEYICEMDSESYNDIPALADNIMCSTKGNLVVTEFFRLMQEQYNAYLNSNESVLTMRSRELSEIEDPTYKIVGPDVVAEAFINVEIEKIPFGPYLNREKFKKKLVYKAFHYSEMSDFFGDFSGYGDGTWKSPRNNDTAYCLYERLLKNVMYIPLLKILNNMKKDGLELSAQFEKIKEILEVVDEAKDESLKVEKIRDLLKEDPKLWAEMYRYFRPGYLATLAINETDKLKKLNILFYQVKKDWPAFIAQLRCLEKDHSMRLSEEAPRRFSNPILDAAAKDQNTRLGEMIFKGPDYFEKYWLSVAKYEREREMTDTKEKREEAAAQPLISIQYDKFQQNSTSSHKLCDETGSGKVVRKKSAIVGI